jgi:aminoglycoside phosphotransferase
MIVARVNLIGVQRVNLKTVHEENGYRTFVRLLYTEDASNRVLLSEIRRNQVLYTKFRSSKAFQELEHETNKIDQQKVEEIKALTQQ